MPRISNWWGAVVLPVLTYTLGGRVLQRLERASRDGADIRQASRGAVSAFTAALLYGAAIALSVAIKRSEMSWFLFRSLPLVALLWPVYRAEYMLGFVLALTYLFGAVLPTVIASVVAVISWVLHRTVRRGVAIVIDRLRRTQTSGA
ncbi:MAG: hypothetical protein V4813_07415 [Gemmatimonadota bacterium]